MTNESILGGIDWYGTTTFNQLQMRQFIPAWKALLSNTTDQAEKQILNDVLRLAEQSLKDVHQYLKFEGD